MDKERLASLLTDLLLTASRETCSVEVIESITRILARAVSSEDVSGSLNAAADSMLKTSRGARSVRLTTLQLRSDALALTEHSELAKRESESKLAAMMLRRIAQIMMLVALNGAKRED
jgi:hypothetical protein